MADFELTRAVIAERIDDLLGCVDAGAEYAAEYARDALVLEAEYVELAGWPEGERYIDPTDIDMLQRAIEECGE